MTAPASNADLAALVEAVDGKVIGRRAEIELVVAALHADRHVLVSGPPGTGKSTLLRALAQSMGSGFVLVEGNAELTPARLAGWFDPARVLAEGYRDDVFVAGPLVRALRDGSLLYVEELNRVPEETVNLLITVMSEGELNLARLGRVAAAPGFRLVAAMNPYDTVGTARVSSAVYDRVCRVVMNYQRAADERRIVRQRSRSDCETTIRRAVAVTRATRRHRDLRVGSSVRGAIDLTELAAGLARLRGVSSDDPDIGLDAAVAALAGRIRPEEATDRSADEIVAELWATVIAAEKSALPAATGTTADPAEGDPEAGAAAGKAGAPGGAGTSGG